MNHREATQKAAELVEMLKSKYADIVAHIDVVDGTNDIVISFFWNRKSVEMWNDTQSFRCEAKDYQKLLETEIIPFFK